MENEVPDDDRERMRRHRVAQSPLSTLTDAPAGLDPWPLAKAGAVNRCARHRSRKSGGSASGSDGWRVMACASESCADVLKFIRTAEEVKSQRELTTASLHIPFHCGVSW